MNIKEHSQYFTDNKTTTNQKGKKSSEEKEIKANSIITFLCINFERLACYNDSYFPDLDERIFFEFLLYRSDYNILKNKSQKSPVSYSNVRNKICIKTDRQKKLLKKFEDKNLISTSLDGYHGSKQIQVNYDVLISEFDNIYLTGEDEPDRKREHLKELKNHFRYISDFI
jgi:hypothetical protein